MIAWIVVLLAVGGVAGDNEPDYETLYACESRQLHIVCEVNKIIRLLRANYGRFSISICNEHGNLDWSVDCTSAASSDVIKDACEMKNNCSLPASPALFGDPCPGTPKYLEAHYRCVPENSFGAPLTSTAASTSSSTSTSRPPIIIPVTRNVRPYLPAMVTDEAPTTTSPAPTSSAYEPPEPPATSPAPSSTTAALELNAVFTSNVFLSGAAETSTTEPSTIHLSRWSPGTNQEQEEEDPQPGVWCSPSYSRGLYWNWTRPGNVAMHRCPSGTRGHAKWRCDVETFQWTPDLPDFSNCTSLWIDEIRYKISRGDQVTLLAAELAALTRNRTLMPGDIVHTADLLHKLVAEMADRNREVEDPQHRQGLLLALLDSVLAVSSNLLEDSQRLSWRDLSEKQQQKSASALLKSQEKSGWLLAESHHSRFNVQSGQPHVLAAVHVVESWDIADVVLPPPLDTTWWRVEDRLLVPAPALLATAKQGVSRLVLLLHHRLGDLLGTEVHPAQNPSTNLTRVINSRVIGALLEGHRVLSLPRPITVTFQHLQVENVSNPMCVFWDYQLRSWSTEGCWLKYSNRTHTVCQCSHLTNLAIIMHVSEPQDQPLHSEHVTLRMLVYIGCAVAMVFLLVTILILQFVRSVRTERIAIHKHLCLCLLLAEAALVGGLEQTDEQRACSVLAGLLHYLLLAAFAWAFLDSFHLYILLGDTELHQDRWRVRWYSSVAYGVPLVVVAISALIDPASYGTNNYCWLRVDNYYVFSFGGPAIACALASVLFLCLTVGRVCSQRNSSIPVKNKDQSKLSAVSRWSGEATVLLLILCSTWTLLPLFLHKERPLTAYFFLALNSLQGLLVFLFYCVSGDKIYGSEEPPGPVCLCPCFRQTSQRRTHHHQLYSPTSTTCHQTQGVGSPLSPNHSQHIQNLTPPMFPDRHYGMESREEHQLQYLLQPGDSVHHVWRNRAPDERALYNYRASHGPASPENSEPHYETLEPQEDPRVEADSPRPIFISLAAVLNVGANSTSPCRVAYSGIQSPTDSERSSSIDYHKAMVSPSSSPGNDYLSDIERRTVPPIGIPASQTY